MKKELINLVKKVRSPVMRFLRPKARYFLFKPKRSLKPISTKFGFDRGEPIDRYYIESFLEENKDYIKGVCLEITDNAYTKKFGGDRVVKSDVLDIDRTNKQANIYGDLRNGNDDTLENIKGVPKLNTFQERILFVILHELGHFIQYNKHEKWYNRFQLSPVEQMLICSEQEYRETKVERNADKLAIALFNKYSEKLLTKFSGFCISWAIPAVSSPKEAIFSDCTSWS